MRWRARLTVSIGLALVPLALCRPAHGQKPDDPARPIVVLVHVPGADTAAVEAFGSVLRAHLGPDTGLRVVEGNPPAGEEQERLRWGTSLAVREDARAVMWVQGEDASDEAVLWVVLPDSSEPRSFEAREPEEFDRYRSLAIGARSILREAGETSRPEPEAPAPPAPTPERAAPAAAPHAATDAERKPDTEEPPRAPDESSTVSMADNTEAWRFHGVMAPVLRMSARDTAVGFDAGVGFRLHRHAALRLELGLTREQRLSGADMSFARNRTALALLGFATAPWRPWYLHGGGGFGAAVGSVDSAAASDEGPRLAATAEGLVAIGWQLGSSLFVELPVSLSFAFAQQQASLGDVVPAFELAVGVALGVGQR